MKVLFAILLALSVGACNWNPFETPKKAETKPTITHVQAPAPAVAPITTPKATPVMEHAKKQSRRDRR